jgi:hypothetical protein
MLTVVVPAYQRYDCVHIIVNCFLIQTSPNWHMHIVADGHDPRMRETVQRYLDRPSIEYHEIDRPGGRLRFGHEGRNLGLRLATTPYVLMTSHDNYYVPTFVEEFEQVATRTCADMILFDMLHSYVRYDAQQFLRQSLRHQAIDIGGFAVRTELAKRVGGITHLGSPSGDWEFVRALLLDKPDLHCEWIPRCLYIHN